MNKVFIVGLDGAIWALVQNWINQGYLPQLAACRVREPIVGRIHDRERTVEHRDSSFLLSTAWDLSCSYGDAPPSERGLFYEWRLIDINVPMTYPAEGDPNALPPRARASPWSLLKRSLADAR